jgi:hypothetical protein
MIASIHTILAIPAERAWSTLLRRDTFLYITRGLLGFAGSDRWPAQFRQGDTIETRLLFFHVVPAWRHTLHLVSVDEKAGELISAESGGPVTRWNHRIAIAALSPQSCRYGDTIDIRAGILTPLVWAYAHVFYRYRQMRWRRLARELRE